MYIIMIVVTPLRPSAIVDDADGWSLTELNRAIIAVTDNYNNFKDS